MPSLADLFKTKLLNNGKTAEGQIMSNISPNQTPILNTFDNKILSSGNTASEQFDIRNSKDIPIRTSNSILNTTIFPIVQKTLRSSGLLTARTKENLVESELVGLRAIGTLSQPIIYGTDIVRINRRTTSSVITMKTAATGTEFTPDVGVFGNIIELGKKKANTLLSKVGITFPENLLPSKLAYDSPLNSGKNGGGEPDTMITLAKIKGDGAGSLLGKFLQQNAKGTPKQIGNQLIGGVISAAKNKLKTKLYGAANEFVNNPDFIQKSNETISLKNMDNFPYSSKINGDNSRYSSRIIKFNDSYSSFVNGDISDLSKTLYEIQSGQQSTFVDGKNRQDLKDYSNNTENVLPEMRVTQNIPARVSKSRYTNSSAVAQYNVGGQLGKLRSNADVVNASRPWYSENGDLPIVFNDKTLDDYDFIPLRFYSVSKKTGVSFRAVISGLNETFAPSWEGAKFIGNPYSFYTYSGVERSVSFNFKVFSLNPVEHIAAWQKLNFLAGLTYPQNQTNDTNQPYITPPIMKFTLGDMYKNKEGYVDSLSFNVDDTTPWEIGFRAEKEDNRITNVDNDGITKNYKLPTIIDVSITVKFIETSSKIAGKRLYSYGGNTTNDEDMYNIKMDGTAIKPQNKPIASTPVRTNDGGIGGVSVRNPFDDTITSNNQKIIDEIKTKGVLPKNSPIVQNLEKRGLFGKIPFKNK
jgi:hypothetical protein